MKNIPFNRPYISNEEKQGIIACLESSWLTTGPQAAKFEEGLKEYCSNEYAVGISSCTAAMHVALHSLGVGKGDEVITTPFTFIGTVEAIIYTGATPVLVDVDSETLNIDPAKIEEKITKKTKAILPVHYAGHPCAMDEILAIAKKYNVKVVEDAAHAIGAEYKGERVGSLSSDATCFSFYATKNITTGEGGALLTHNEGLANRVRRLSIHGITKDSLERYGANADWQYDVAEVGFKYNLSDVHAAIGVAQLKKLDRMNARRREIAMIYNESFHENEHVMTPVERDHVTHAWHLYPIRVQNREMRDTLFRALKTKGIGTSVHFIPVCSFSLMQEKYGFSEKDYPVAIDAFNRILSLPLYPSLTDEEVRYVADAVNEIVL